MRSWLRLLNKKFAVFALKTTNNNRHFVIYNVEADIISMKIVLKNGWEFKIYVHYVINRLFCEGIKKKKNFIYFKFKIKIKK